MSMHMIRGVQVHGNSKRKSKKKLDMKKLEVEWRQYNKRMRQANCHSAQFETLNDYVQYVTGNTKLTKKEFTPYEPKESQPRRTTENYPSLSTESIPGAGTKKESQVYSGDYIVGIATMHKSNLVPVGRGDNPSNYATMRRN